MAGEEQPAQIEKRRKSDAWHVDRTINLPTVFLVVGGIFSLIMWGKGLESTVTYERDARIRMEAAADKERIARQSDRTELISAQNQLRIEMNALVRETKTEIKQELRDLRNVINSKSNPQ